MRVHQTPYLNLETLVGKLVVKNKYIIPSPKENNNGVIVENPIYS